MAHGGFISDWINVTDPTAWLAHLQDQVRRNGGRIVTSTVGSLALTDGEPVLHGTAGALRAGHVVIAAGAWSNRIAATLGESLPLETKRGYNTTHPDPGFDLRTQINSADQGFIVTHAGEAIRVGGTVELGGLSAPPNYRRARVMLDKAMRFLPGLSDKNGRPWMGFRPSMPDSLPVIGRARHTARVIYAFGHGHLGLTQSAGTAELVADLVLNRPSAIDITPHRPDRFRWFIGG